MKKDSPGVYIPPPLIYVAVFLFSVWLGRIIPLPLTVPGNKLILVTGSIFILLGLFISFPALWRFLVSKNTLVPVKPAKSLQTTGIYSRSRNPMYLGLLLLYCGLAFFKGNGWTFILLPLLIGVVQYYVIRKEENYLHRAFGEEFASYTKQVRRWI